MRITYLHQYFNTPDMPGGTRSYEMARRLAAMGHEVNMVTSWREPDSREGWMTTNQDGIQVHWFAAPYSNHMSYGERIASFLAFAWAAARRAAKIPADVVFATSTPLTIAFPGVFAARKQRAPMVFEVRDLWPELPIAVGALKNPVTRGAARRLEIFAYRSSEQIIALSPGMAEGIIQKGFDASRVTVIPNSCDLDLFCPGEDSRKRFRENFGICDQKILIVYAGTFGKINGVRYLVELAKQLLDDPRFQLVSVGDGQDFERVNGIARQLGVLDENLLMLPAMPKNEIPDVLLAADIATSLFLPIREMEANSANKFFDGLAAGCCMAINYDGWQAELLAQSHAGIKLECDPVRAAWQLKELADHPERIVMAKAAARRLAEDLFSREKLAIQMEQVLVRAVASYS